MGKSKANASKMRLPFTIWEESASVHEFRGTDAERDS